MHIKKQALLTVGLLAGLAVALAAAQKGGQYQVSDLGGWLHRDLSTGVEFRLDDIQQAVAGQAALAVSVRDLEGAGELDRDVESARALVGTESIELERDQAGVFRGWLAPPALGPASSKNTVRLEALEDDGEVVAHFQLEDWVFPGP